MSERGNAWRVRAAVMLPVLCLLGVLAVSARADSPAQLSQSTAPEVWFSPYPLGTKGDGSQVGFGAADFMDLFEADAPWEQAAANVDVFKLYTGWVIVATDEELAQVVSDLNARGIAIALEMTSLKVQPTCGQGVEGFVVDPLALATEALVKVTAAGGTVAAIALQEPFTFAGPSFNSMPTACHWTAAQTAAETWQFVSALRETYPGLQFGDIESDHVDPASLAGWLDAYEAVSGEPFAFFHLDVDWQANSEWPSAAKQVELAVRSRGIPFGMIYNGNADDPTDGAWIESAVGHMGVYEGEAGGDPDQVIFQSWHLHPQHVLPETDPTAMTSLIDRYFTARSSVALSVGAQAGTAWPVTATVRDDGGNPIAGARVDLQVSPADGPGLPATYTIAGPIPDGAIRAVLGFRVNTECNCAGSQSRFLLSSASFKVGSSSTELLPNPSFASGFSPWFALGAASFSSSPRGVRVDAASSGVTALLNSASAPASGAALTPGQHFTATFTASVDPRSIGSGYFTVIFLTASWTEVGRFRTAIEPAVTMLSAITGADGTASFNVSPPGARLKLRATIADTVSRWAAFSPAVSVGALAPQLLSAAPSSLTAGAPATVLQLTGTGFSWDSVASWDGSPRPTTVLSATSATVSLTAADLVTSGPHQLAITTPAPGGGTSALALSLAPKPASLAFTQQPTTGQAGTPFALQPKVAVRDGSGNVITTDNSTVITLSLQGTGALTCNGGLTATAVSGIASFAGCAINAAQPGAVLKASTPSVPAAGTSSAFPVLGGTAAKLAFVQQPTSAQAGAPFSAQPKVAIQDANGATVTTDNSTVVTLALQGTGALSCTGGLTATAANGVATFAGCALTAIQSAAILRATSSPVLAAATSTAFAVKVGPATSLIFVQQPTTTAVNGLIPVLKVAIVDPAGNVVFADTALVTLALQGSGILKCSGGLSTRPVNGIAMFVNCSVNQVQAAASISATAFPARTPAVSTAFAITPGPAAKLVWLEQPASAKPGVVFTVAPKAALQDAYGNVVTTNSTTVVTLSATGGGTLSCTGGLTAQAVNGVVTFNGCKLSAAASSATLKVSAGSYIAAATSKAFAVR